MTKLRSPSMEECLWPRGVKASGFKGCTFHYCPKLECQVSIIPTCYSCEIGFNGECPALNSKLCENPSILPEIYKPYAQLKAVTTNRNAVFYKGKFYTLDSAKNLEDKESIYLVHQKYIVSIRFVPKYFETRNTFIENKVFCKKGIPSVFSFEEIPYNCKSTEEVVRVFKDKTTEDYFKIMEITGG